MYFKRFEKNSAGNEKKNNGTKNLISFILDELKDGYKSEMYIEMHLTHNEGKSIVSEKFIKKIYKHMIAL